MAMPTRRRKTNSKTAKAKATCKPKAARAKPTSALDEDPFARARWISKTYGIPFTVVKDELASHDAGCNDGVPVYVTWEMIRAYDSVASRLEAEYAQKRIAYRQLRVPKTLTRFRREEAFARRLLETNDPRIQNMIDRCLIAAERTEPLGYSPRARRDLMPTNSMAEIEKTSDGSAQLNRRSLYRRAHILPDAEVKSQSPNSTYPVSDVELVRVYCNHCRQTLEVLIRDAHPLFQSGFCPFCRKAMFSRINIENEPFMLLWRALERFKDFEQNYMVSFLVFNPE